MFKKLAQKLCTKKKFSTTINPLEVDFDHRKNVFLDKLSENAVKINKKECDIKNFSKLVLSNPENTDHNEMVKELFDDGVTDPFIDEKLSILADNKRFLNDLGLL